MQVTCQWFSGKDALSRTHKTHYCKRTFAQYPFHKSLFSGGMYIQVPGWELQVAGQNFTKCVGIFKRCFAHFDRVTLTIGATK